MFVKRNCKKPRRWLAPDGRLQGCRPESLQSSNKVGPQTRALRTCAQPNIRRGGKCSHSHWVQESHRETWYSLVRIAETETKLWPQPQWKWIGGFCREHQAAPTGGQSVRCAWQLCVPVSAAWKPPESMLCDREGLSLRVSALCSWAVPHVRNKNTARRLQGPVFPCLHRPHPTLPRCPAHTAGFSVTQSAWLHGTRVQGAAELADDLG